MRSATSTAAASDLATVNRVVHGHDWEDLSEWVTTIEHLADLTDEQIDEVVAYPAVS